MKTPTQPQSSAMDYDPNLTSSGRTAKQTVKLTFGQWDYRAERTVEVGGNCTGLIVIESAVCRLYEELPEMSDGMGGRALGIVLTRPGNGEEDTLECTDDEDQGDDWLKDMLIGAEIIAIRPDRNLYAEAAKEGAK